MPTKTNDAADMMHEGPISGLWALTSSFVDARLPAVLPTLARYARLSELGGVNRLLHCIVMSTRRSSPCHESWKFGHELVAALPLPPMQRMSMHTPQKENPRVYVFYSWTRVPSNLWDACLPSTCDGFELLRGRGCVSRSRLRWWYESSSKSETENRCATL